MEQTEKKKTGRKLLDLDENLIARLASIHCTMKEIAAVVGCSVDTLENRFSDLIKESREKGKMSLRRWQWQLAEKQNLGMLVWLGKQHLEQRDIKEFKPIHPDDQPTIKDIDDDILELKNLLRDRPNPKTE